MKFFAESSTFYRQQHLQLTWLPLYYQNNAKGCEYFEFTRFSRRIKVKMTMLRICLTISSFFVSSRRNSLYLRSISMVSGFGSYVVIRNVTLLKQLEGKVSSRKQRKKWKLVHWQGLKASRVECLQGKTNTDRWNHMIITSTSTFFFLKANFFIMKTKIASNSTSFFAISPICL